VSETRTYNPVPEGRDLPQGKKQSSVTRTSKKKVGKETKTRDGGEFLEQKSRKFNVISSKG
jgi:hypothetical protein